MSNQTEVLEAVRNCERRIANLEKERHSRLVRKHDVQSSFHELDDVYWKNEMERKAEKVELQQDIGRIRNCIAGFQKLLSNVKTDPAIVPKLKNAMEEIETSISRFKEKQREVYETLLLEEQSTSVEISVFEKKLDTWSTTESAPKAEPVAGSGATASPSSSTPVAVVAFQRFIQQTGGRQGGWDDFDHKAFLKVRMIHSGSKSSFINAVSKEVPTKTGEEIAQHDQWYTEYSALSEKKKKAIEEWKEHKKTKATVEETLDREALEKESNLQEVIEKERAERFSKLSAWKEEKKQKHFEEERLRTEKENKDAKKKQLEFKRREKLKTKVKEYVLAREEHLSQARERDEMKAQQESAERIQIAAKEIELFRERDKRALERKKQAVEAKESEKLDRMKQLDKLKEQVQVKVSRDPSRLHKLTAGWEERKKAAPGPTTGPCLSLPKRAVPSWRQPS